VVTSQQIIGGIASPSKIAGGTCPMLIAALKQFRLLWKFLNITDVFDYLRFNFKTQNFVMILPIKAQIRTQKFKCVRSHNKVR